MAAGQGFNFTVACNGVRMSAFRFQVGRLWRRTLRRRSLAKHLSWKRKHRIVAHWLLAAHICHPYRTNV